MPHPDSPFDDEVYLAWEAIAFSDPEMTVAQKRTKWKELYESVFVNSSWTCNTPTVGLVTSMGLTQALTDSRFEDAINLATAYLTIPDAAQDVIEASFHWGRLGVAFWLHEEIEKAIQHWVNLEECQVRSVRRVYNIHLWDAVLRLLEASGVEKSCEPELRSFVVRFLGWFPNQKRNIARVEQANTNLDLHKGLVALKPTLFRGIIRRERQTETDS